MFCLPPLERNRCKDFVDCGLTRPGTLTRFRRSRRAAPSVRGLDPCGCHALSPGTEALSAGPVETAWVCAEDSGLLPELSLAPVSFERRPGESFPQTEGGPPRGPAGNASGPGRLDQAAHSTCPPRADPARTD